MGYVHTSFFGGHRYEYHKLLLELFDLKSSVGKVNSAIFISFMRVDKLLFSTVDDDLIGFVWVGLGRSLVGKKTVGLFLRPQSCFEKKIKGFLKRGICSLLKKNPMVSLVVIQPYIVNQKLEKVSDIWVHDPQLWDKIEDEEVETTRLSERIQSKKNNRLVLSYFGKVTSYKGFDYLVQLFDANPGLIDFFTVFVGGVVDPDCDEVLKKGKEIGFKIKEGFLDEKDLMSMYRISDLVWSCYSPEYDQASGVFGRSVQHGCCSIVRKGSFLSKYACLFDINVMSFDLDVISDAERLMNYISDKCIGSEYKTNALEWKYEFVDKINDCF